METISELKSEAAELRKIVDKLDEVAIALARTVHRKKEPDAQLPSPVEPISESSAGSVVEKTVWSSPPDIRQASNGASHLAVLPMPPQMERRTEPSDQEIRRQAYFLSERRLRFALPGDADSDWQEAKHQLLCKSGELARLSTITAGESDRIRRATPDVALPSMVASAKPRVESIERGNGLYYETILAEIQSSAAEAIPEPASKFQNAVSVEPVFPQIQTLPTIPDTSQNPSFTADKSQSDATPETHPTGPTGTSVQVTFSFEITGVQLAPTFEMSALTVRLASSLVTMRLPLDLKSQSTKDLYVSLEAVKIQPVGDTLGTLRMIPSERQGPVANSSHSFASVGLQVVPNFKAGPIQLTPSHPAQAPVFVTIPCEISLVEFSPLLEIASVIFNSNSKRLLLQLAGTRPSGKEPTRVCEIANLEITESGEISTMQLDLLAPADASVT